MQTFYFMYNYSTVFFEKANLLLFGLFKIRFGFFLLSE